MKMVAENASPGSVKQTCNALGVSRATYYRRKKQLENPSDQEVPAEETRRPHPRRLSPEEEQRVLDIFDEEENADRSPYQVFASLLNLGIYLCSIRTMYRLLKREEAVAERRNQRRHPSHPKPQLVATAPNQVWTWDITKIPGPRKGVFYCLYVMLDLFSRYVVSWTLNVGESTGVAKTLINHAYATQGIEPGQITIHADRGSPMTSSGLYTLFETLGVKGSHSRPRVSNDNPYSESHFKTLKYHHTYPKRFETLQQAESYFDEFFSWYNHEHHHSGIGLFTPAQVHSGEYVAIQSVRQAAMDKAYAENAVRFVKGPPKAPSVPESAAINPEPLLLVSEDAQTPSQGAHTS